MARDSLIKIRRGAASTWTSANPTLAAGELGWESDTNKLKIGDGSTAWSSLAYFAPGGGSGDVATDPIWDAKGDLAGGTGADAAARLAVGTNGKLLVAASGETTGLKWDTGHLGGLELVYRYTVAGSDKSGIDTGSDTADAGSGVWTAGDVLEVWLVHKTDTNAETDTVDVTVNNDTSSIYDRQVLSGANVTAAAAQVLAAANWNLGSKGSPSGGDSYAVTSKFAFPAYNNTNFWKTGEGSAMRADDTSASNASVVYALGYRSTTAISRIAVVPHTGGAKLKVGSMLVVYKRRNT